MLELVLQSCAPQVKSDNKRRWTEVQHFPSDAVQMSPSRLCCSCVMAEQKWLAGMAWGKASVLALGHEWSSRWLSIKEKAIVPVCDGVIFIPSSVCFLHSEEDDLGLHLPVRPLWRPILFGEGFELKGVKGVFATSHVLHGVLSPAALAVDKQAWRYLLIQDLEPEI